MTFSAATPPRATNSAIVTTLRDKMLESEALVAQAQNNTKTQFDNSPTLKAELLNAIIEAFVAQTALS